MSWSEDAGISWSNDPVFVQSDVLFRAVVKNIGRAALTGPLLIEWRVNGSAAASATMTGGLSRNTSRIVVASATWTPVTAGNQTVVARADPANSILEGNEGNNAFSLPLVVEADGSTGPTPPPAAAAVGYTRLAFEEDFNGTGGIDMADSRQPGFNFYRFRPHGYPVMPLSAFSVANSILTINNTGTFTTNNGLNTTCGQPGGTWTGYEAANGAYFEARIQNPQNDPSPSVDGWPSFWSDPSRHMWGGVVTNYFELDFYEKIPDQFPNSYTCGCHEWATTTQSRNDLNTILACPVGYDWNAYHIYGLLWLPGSRHEVHRDNVLVETRTFAQLPWLAACDRERLTIMLGSDGGFPMNVDWVRVWQAP
jgi:hypothetical protein